MRRGFTLIELIFVIVIIGLLAAVAVPKFVNLKQHAEANNVVKTTVDVAQQAAEAAVNYIDLEGNDSITLTDLVKLNGKDWNVSDDNNSYYYNDGGDGNVSEVNFSVDDREVNYSINCNNFKDKTTQRKCQGVIGSSSTGTITLKF